MGRKLRQPATVPTAETLPDATADARLPVIEPTRPPFLRLQLRQFPVDEEIDLQLASLAEGHESDPAGPLIPCLLRVADAEPEEIRGRTMTPGASPGTIEMELLGHLD